MAKTVIDGKKTDIKIQSRNPIIPFDKLQLYFMKPYVIDLEESPGSITLLQPKVYDVIDFGTDRFYSTLNIFTTNTTSYKYMLSKQKIDWNTFSDFELFIMLYQSIDQEASDLIFKDIVWENFKIYTKQIGENQSMILYDDKNNIEINELVYFHFSQYLQKIFNIKIKKSRRVEVGITPTRLMTSLFSSAN